MEDLTREGLQEVITQLIESLGSLEPGSREYSNAVSDLNDLYKLKIEEIKNDWEYDEKYNRRIMEETQHQLDGQLKEKQIDGEARDRERDLDLREAQLKDQTIERYFKYGVEVGLALITLGFYSGWMKKGFKFEETGTFTSKTFMGLVNRFRPTR